MAAGIEPILASAFAGRQWLIRLRDETFLAGDSPVANWIAGMA
jgi:hypothetical protein